MKIRNYRTADDFRRAIESKLRQRDGGKNLYWLRELLIRDRFLARLTLVLGDLVVLKGGLALQFRLERARMTQDIDLRVSGDPASLLASLQEAGDIDLGDFMSFEVEPRPDGDEIVSEGVVYEGFRFRVRCRLDGKRYGEFGLDAAYGDAIIGTPDLIAAPDLLDFAGIAPPVIRVYPIVSHLAEKLHAYTMPRQRVNSRVKDLPDIALLATTGPVDAAALRAALHATFTARATHPRPTLLAEPPPAWAAGYARIAAENDLPWKTLDEVTAAARSFLDPILNGHAHGAWSPDRWAWVAPPALTA
jgi:hypothetical protein